VPREAFVVVDAFPLGGMAVPDFEFNVATGEASSNVKVHRYRGRNDWRIEIEL
jgi:hypothetical protein